MSLIELRHVGKTYCPHAKADPLPVLFDIDLRIQKGEYIAIMGPSGSGKSTLLNILGCLDRPSTGQYLFHQKDVSQLNDNALSQIRNRKIGYVFQSFNLIPQLTVLENISIPLYYHDKTEKEIRQRAAELAQSVGLDDRVHHRPTELSGGQQQRTAIARALANRPLLILADEPTGNLDTKTGRDILLLLDRLNQSGTTLLVITHDDQVALCAKRVLRLRDGRIAADTTNDR